jgi:polyhydroxyalkanoate synthesis regulator phasin
MTTAEERLKILKMIQEGKITAEEGAKLLKALSASSQKPKRQPSARTTGAARWLRVRVTDMSSGKSRRILRWLA